MLQTPTCSPFTVHSYDPLHSFTSTIYLCKYQLLLYITAKPVKIAGISLSFSVHVFNVTWGVNFFVLFFVFSLLMLGMEPKPPAC